MKANTRVLTREWAYIAIDSEREYQDRRWNENTTATAGKHSVAEFVLFMDDYLSEAKTQLSRNGEPKGSNLALDTVRKVAALAVACMEQHGAPIRHTFDQSRLEQSSPATKQDGQEPSPHVEKGAAFRHEATQIHARACARGNFEGQA